MTVAAFATLPLVWTVRGPRRCPSGPPSGPVDVAAGRLVRLVTVADPGLRLAALRRYGLGPTGLPPVGPNRLGVGRDEWNRTHEALTRVARGSGPPVPLLDALVLLEEHLPASPGRLALLMQQRRLTDRPLHPLAVVELGRLWWLPVPPARLVSRGPGGLDPSRAVVLTGTATEAGLAGLARRVRRAGAVPLTVATGVARASGLSADDPAAVDLLAHWRLYHQGSRVVWDHDGGGPLARAVQRTLAACGPLPARDLVVGLGRARFSRLGPVPPLTDPGLLLSWAREPPSACATSWWPSTATTRPPRRSSGPGRTGCCTRSPPTGNPTRSGSCGTRSSWPGSPTTTTPRRPGSRPRPTSKVSRAAG